MPQTRKIEITFENDGTVTIPWWVNEISDIICAICGYKDTPKCEEKKKSIIFNDCPNRNPYCG